MNYDLSKKYKTIIVTGGAGFIGGNLIQNLIINSEVKIINIDKMGYASNLYGIEKSQKLAGSSSIPRHILYVSDINNKDNLLKIFQNNAPDLIFHLAAESHVDRSIEGPEEFIHSNVNGTLNMLETARIYWKELESNKRNNFRFIHVSTDEVYGSLGCKGFFNEESRYAPNSPYAASKASSDHLVRAWNRTYNFPTIITNCSNNFGPWQFPEKLIPLTITKAIKNEEIPLYGDGSNIRDWIFVEDHVDALINIALRGKIGKTYCIGGNNQLSNKELVELICSILDKLMPTKNSYKKLIKNVPDRPGHDYRYAIDNSLIKNELGWDVKFEFKERLEQTVNWYLNNKSWCENFKKKSNFKGDRIANPNKIL